jgi:hypothetical protein
MIEKCEKQYEVLLSAKELRYLVSCGAALLQNVPEKALATYTHFTKQEIIDFSKRMRALMDSHGLDI